MNRKNILFSILFLISALHLTLFFEPSFKEPPSWWLDYRHFIIFFLVFVALVSKNLRLISYFIFFLFFSYYALLTIPPFSDQLMQYHTIKSIDFLSPGRPLYSDYRGFPENFIGSTSIGYTVENLDYTYLPFSLFPGLFSVIYGIDPRIIHLSLYLLFVIFICKLTKGFKREIFAILLLCSFVPAYVFRLYHLTNTSLFLFALSSIILAYFLRQSSKVFSALLFIPAFCTLQSTWLFYPFVFFSFYKKKATKVFLLGSAFAALFMSFFVLPDIKQFFESAIYPHSGKTDLLVLNATNETRPYTLFGFFIFITGFSAKEWISFYPAKTISFSIIAVSFLLYLKRKDFSLKTALRHSAFTSVLSVLTLRYSFLGFRYFLPQLFFAYFDDLDKSISLSKKAKVFITCILLLLIIQIYFAKNHIETKPNYNFSFKTLDKSDINRANPSLRFNLKRGFGWMNTLSGSQFWILAKPGNYRASICNNEGCKYKEYVINNERSVALRIPFEVTLEEDASVTMGFLEIKHTGWKVRNIERVRNVESFSLERSSS